MPLTTCREDEEEDYCEDADDDEADYDTIARKTAAFRIDAIISKATDQLIEGSNKDRGFGENWSTAEDASSSISAPRRKVVKSQARHGPSAAQTAQRAAAIERILVAPRQPALLRSFAAEQDFGRIPPCVQRVHAELEDELEYISTLHEHREVPKVHVRLLEKGEREQLLHGLKLKFKRSSASYLQAPARSKLRAELEAEMASIKEDIESLSRQYIFVEADS